MRSALKLDSLATHTYRSDERTSFLLPYTKGSLMLVTLERHLGFETMRRILATLTDRFWFRHPRPADFVAIANEVSGQDLRWYFDQVLAGTHLFDYAVDRVVSQPRRSPTGYGTEPGSTTVRAGAVLTGADAGFDSVVDIRRWEEGTFPVEVRVTFADGSVAREQWNGQDRRVRFTYTTTSRIRTVEVDPERVLVLDVNSTNNSWTSSPGAETGARKWTAKWMIWVQQVFESAAFFA